MMVGGGPNNNPTPHTVQLAAMQMDIIGVSLQFVLQFVQFVMHELLQSVVDAHVLPQKKLYF